MSLFGSLLSTRAVFIDRDGVITMERADHVKTVEEMEIIPNVTNALAKLSRLDYKIIVITNQSVINRGLATDSEINLIHKRMSDVLSSEGCRIDAIYYCPHRPDEKCNCRKPKIGLIINAARDFGIDVNRSWFVGDKRTDAIAAERAGCQFLKVETNAPGSLMKAVDIIFETEAKSLEKVSSS
jgi:D-glycero-D-manno-heptose 1,7-bisphosphate phosphatase